MSKPKQPTSLNRNKAFLKDLAALVKKYPEVFIYTISPEDAYEQLLREHPNTIKYKPNTADWTSTKLYDIVEECDISIGAYIEGPDGLLRTAIRTIEDREDQEEE